eukprot:49835-Eustigmatos_ZCMA.PRE.1
MTEISEIMACTDHQLTATSLHAHARKRLLPCGVVGLGVLQPRHQIHEAARAEGQGWGEAYGGCVWHKGGRRGEGRIK